MNNKKIKISILVILITICTVVSIGLGRSYMYSKSIFKEFEKAPSVLISSSGSGEMLKEKGLYSYNIAKGIYEKIFNDDLDKISFISDKSKLIGLDYSSEGGYYGSIKEINLTTHRQEIILTGEQSVKPMDGDDPNNTVVKYVPNSNNISILNNNQIFIFDRKAKIFEKLYDAFEKNVKILKDFMWSDDGKFLYINENRNIYKYNVKTKEKELLLNNIGEFAVSHDGQKIVYLERDSNMLYYYTLINQIKNPIQKLNSLNSQNTTIYFSEDDNYVLFRNVKDSFIPTNFKQSLNIYGIKNDMKWKIIEWGYADSANIHGVLWNR